MIDYTPGIKLEHTIPKAEDLKEIYYEVQARKDAKELFEKKVYPSLAKGKNSALKIFDHPINITTDEKSKERLFALANYLLDRGYQIYFGKQWKKQEASFEYTSIKIVWEN